MADLGEDSAYPNRTASARASRRLRLCVYTAVDGNMGTVLPRSRAHTDASITLRLSTDLAAIEQQWREFQRTACYTVFQSFDWLLEWYNHIGAAKNVTPVIVSGSVDGDTCFLLPLAIEPGFTRRLVWLGVGLADYNAPLLAPDFRRHIPPGKFPSVWREVVAVIRDDPKLVFDLVELDKMPPKIIDEPNPFCELPVMIAEYGSHAAMLTDSWEPFYESRLSPKTRSADRRKLRRLNESGPVRFVEVEEPEEIQSTLTDLIEQKKCSYARMGIADQFAIPGHAEFYRAVAANPNLRSVVHVTRVDIGEDRAAIGLALRFKSRYHMILQSYQEQYAKYSPGGHHIQRILQYAIAQGMHICDFTIGDETYKDQWCDVVSPLLRYYEGRTIRGYVLVGLVRLRHYAVRCYKLYKERRRPS